MRFIRFNYINLFNTVLFFVLFLLLSVQLILTVPALKDFAYELGIGKSLYASTETDKPYMGKITLELKNAEADGKITVLQNGEPVAVFFKNTVEINVPDNTVIEIDGTAATGCFIIKTTYFSPEIINQNPKEIEINENIVTLDRYFLK